MKNYTITKEQILELSKDAHPAVVGQLKEWFPDVFSLPNNFTGWCKVRGIGNEKWIGKFENGKFKHGIGANGNWFCEQNGFHKFNISNNDYYEATHQEVETALKNEAVKWYKVGDYIDCINGVIVDIRGINFNYKDGALYIADSHTKYKVFENGIWATVIPTMSLKEAEEKLNVKIV